VSNPISPLTPTQETHQKESAAHESYPHRVIEEVDVLGNVMTGGRQDETISSRAARAAVAGKWWGKALSSALNVFQKNHGAKAQAADLARAEEIEKVEHSDGILPE